MSKTFVVDADCRACGGDGWVEYDNRTENGNKPCPACKGKGTQPLTWTLLTLDELPWTGPNSHGQRQLDYTVPANTSVTSTAFSTRPKTVGAPGDHLIGLEDANGIELRKA